MKHFHNIDLYGGKYKLALQLTAFELKIDIRIIERPEGTPNNVKTAAWIPQVDILSDPKTQVFISHCGNHGAHEDGFDMS